MAITILPPKGQIQLCGRWQIKVGGNLKHSELWIAGGFNPAGSRHYPPRPHIVRCNNRSLILPVQRPSHRRSPSPIQLYPWRITFCSNLAGTRRKRWQEWESHSLIDFPATGAFPVGWVVAGSNVSNWQSTLSALGTFEKVVLGQQPILMEDNRNYYH